MLMFAGLMGMLAVGATAMVGFDVVAKQDNDHDDSAADEHADTNSTNENIGEYLIAMAAESAGIHPVTETIASAVPDYPESVEAEVAAEAEALADDAATDESTAQSGNQAIIDFSAESDRLVIVFDDFVDPDPTVALEEDEDDLARTHVTLNGVRIAAVDEADGLRLDHIGLMPQSFVEDTAEA